MSRDALSTILVPLTVVGLASWCQAQSKVPRPLPVMEDLKTQAPIDGAATRSDADSARLGAGAASRRADKAQSGGLPSLQVASPIDRTRVHFDEDGDGAIWARGADWKARFDATSIQFIPWLGASAPHNFPVEFRLAHARAGDLEIAIEPRERALRDGDSVVLDHGAIDEVWHLTPGAAEQTFVLESRPAGDLTLRIAIETQLAARAEGEEFVFENELGGVRYGRAFALDARGERQALTARLAERAIEIEVPHDILASAVYPLVVDPFVSSFVVADDPTQIESSPDAAWMSTVNRYGVLFTEYFSSTDLDTYWYVMEADGSAVPGLGTYADFTTAAWYRARIAANTLNGTFCAAAQVLPAGGSISDIRVRTRAVASTTMSAQAVISSGAGSMSLPDVGGDPALIGPTYFMVVWTRQYSSSDWDVHARLVSFDGTPLGAGVILLENSPATLDYLPSVSKTDGNLPWQSQVWNVTWLRFSTGDVYAAQVAWDGIVTSSAFLVEQAGDIEDASPSPPLDGGVAPRPWAIAYPDKWYGASPPPDIHFKVLLGNSVLVHENLTALENAGTIQERQTAPAIDTDGEQFVVAYAESFQMSTDEDIYAASLWYVDGRLGLSEGHALLDFSPLTTPDPEIAAQGSAGTSGPRVCAVWTRIDNANTDDAAGAFYDTAGAVTPLSFCAGDGSDGPCPCGNLGAPGNGCANSVNASGANLSASGTARVSSDSLVLHGSGMPNSTALYFQALAASAPVPFGDGLRCAGGGVIRLRIHQNAGGASQFPGSGDPPISVAGNLPDAGAIRYYQVWYRNNAAYCTSDTFNLTNGVEVIWLP